MVGAVAPLGLRDRARGTVTFTTSLGLGRKLERIRKDPRVALAFHVREHGFSSEPGFVLVQGRAEPRHDLDDTMRAHVEAQATRFMGPPRRGRLFWDRWLHEYYSVRIPVEIEVERERLAGRALRGRLRLVWRAPSLRPAGPPASARGHRPACGCAAGSAGWVGRCPPSPARLPGRRFRRTPVVVPSSCERRISGRHRELAAAHGVLPPGARAGRLVGQRTPAAVWPRDALPHRLARVRREGAALYAPTRNSASGRRRTRRCSCSPTG